MRGFFKSAVWWLVAISAIGVVGFLEWSNQNDQFLEDGKAITKDIKIVVTPRSDGKGEIALINRNDWPLEDCKFKITVIMEDGGKRVVDRYWVSWKKDEKKVVYDSFDELNRAQLLTVTGTAWVTDKLSKPIHGGVNLSFVLAKNSPSQIGD